MAEPLTARQLEALRLVSQGLDTKAIARTLGLSQATVEKHIAEGARRLGAPNRQEAARLAFGGEEDLEIPAFLRRLAGVAVHPEVTLDDLNGQKEHDREVNSVTLHLADGSITSGEDLEFCRRELAAISLGAFSRVMAAAPFEGVLHDAVWAWRGHSWSVLTIGGDGYLHIRSPTNQIAETGEPALIVPLCSNVIYSLGSVKVSAAALSAFKLIALAILMKGVEDSKVGADLARQVSNAIDRAFLAEAAQRGNTPIQREDGTIYIYIDRRRRLDEATEGADPSTPGLSQTS